MPRIPGSDPNVRAPAPASLRAAEIDPGMPGRAALAGGLPRDTSAAWDSFGNTAARTGRDIAYQDERRRREEDTAAVAAKYEEAKATWANKLEADLQNEPLGADGFHDRKLAEYDDYTNQVRESLSESQRALFDLKAPSLRGYVSITAARGQAESRRIKLESDFEETVGNAANAVRSNPALFEDSANTIRETMDALGMPPARKELLLKKAWGTLGTMALEGSRERNPYAVVSELESGKWDAILTPAQKDQQLDRAQSQIRVLEREAEAAAREAARDAKMALAQAKADYGLVLQDHLASLARGGAGVPEYSEKEVRRLYGNRADTVLRQVRFAEAQGKVGATIAGQSFAEDTATLAAIAARRSGGTDKVQLEIDDLTERAIGEKRKALLKDPAGYALAVSPRIAADLASEDPAVAARGRAGLRQVQADQGVPAWRQRVLPEAAAHEEVARFKGLPPEQWADRIEALARQYGADFGGAMADMVRAGLPAEAQVLAVLDRPTDAAARKDLARAIQTTRKTLEDSLPEGVKKADIDEAVAGELAPLARSLTAGGAGVEAVAAARNAAELLARLYTVGGEKPGVAAKRAAAAIQDRYDFRDDWRAPKGLGDTMQVLARRALEGLSADTIAPPPPAAGEPAGFTPEQRAAAGLSAAKRGRWVTNERGDGLVLLYPNGTRVLRPDGSRVELRFDEWAYGPFYSRRGN